MRTSFAFTPLYFWSGSRDGSNLPGRRRLISAFLGTIGVLIIFCVFVVPQLKRFRFRSDLSWYDLGIYGFGPSQSYNSFDEESPIVEISPAGAQCDPQLTFLAPRGDSVAHPGPMILDARGELVWMKYNWGTTQDFRVQKYKGQDYLTFWQGDEEDGHGCGSWYMLDSTYNTRYVVSPIGAMDGDLHDFRITANDTAIITIYDPIPADLTSVGGPELGWLYEGVFQEVDIATGKLLFEWRSTQVFPPNSSYEPLDGRGHERTMGYDYFHMNSVDKDDQGRYLVSGRHTHSVTCIDGSTGEALWTLGGKNNDFSDESNGAATGFEWQHDARWHGPNQITLFNNAANGNYDLEKISHGALIELDIPARKATLLTSYNHPQDLMAVSQGNLQVLDTGHVLVGWGHSAAYTEFSEDGHVLCNVHFGASAYFSFGRVVSYRVTKGSWVGTPDTLPDVAVVEDSVSVSWNGATEVASWRLEGWDGGSLENMVFTAVDQVDRTGFETKIPLPPEITSFFRIRAIDVDGDIIGTTEILKRDASSSRGNHLTVYWGVIMIAIFALVCLICGLYCALNHQLQRRKADDKGPYRLIARQEARANNVEIGRY
ncbi:hypothetical protein F1880_008788 [Penicillium rolfsii]|nr:hypothetical protein F1880_008788 [Penicillium rolfsii]